MNNNAAIGILEQILDDYTGDGDSLAECRQAIKIAIGAIKRDSKVDDITFHWNDEKSNFVAACSAFEDILKVYGRGVE